MGKSFNDDIFSNDNMSLENINGISISKEAIEENKKTELEKDIEAFEEQLYQTPITKLRARLKQQGVYQEEPKETQPKKKVRAKQKANKKESSYVKKTMIFNSYHLDVIEGLAKANNTTLKDVLNQLLEQAINQLSEEQINEALKNDTKGTKKLF